VACWPFGGVVRVRIEFFRGGNIMLGMFLTRHGGFVSIIFLLTAVTGLAGCASTSDISRLQQDISAVRQEAQDAKQAAARATQQATEANRKADQAIADSADAQSKAASAQKAAADSNERVDRMFKKSMNK
jgi:murein lipoprotein